MKRSVTVLIEPWRAHPLAWIHRAEARAIAAELRALGDDVRVLRYDGRAPAARDTLLVRVSDPVMAEIAPVLARTGRVYCGPTAEVLARCYDKAAAYAIAGRAGIDIPATCPAATADAMPRPLVLKPRRGSDSIGLRVLRAGPVPAAYRGADYLAQHLVRGTELTVAVLGDAMGAPLRVLLPEGTPYAFWRKYLWSPGRQPVADGTLAGRVQAFAARVAQCFDIRWAARIDLMLERATDRLVFLECDAAPLVGAASAFAASLAAAGMIRVEQLRRLTVAPMRDRAACDAPARVMQRQ